MRNVTQFIYIWKLLYMFSRGTSTHHQEHIQLCLQHLVFVRPLLLPAAVLCNVASCWIYNRIYLSLTSALEGVGCLTSHSGCYSSSLKTWCSWYRRLVGHWHPALEACGISLPHRGLNTEASSP